MRSAGIPACSAVIVSRKLINAKSSVKRLFLEVRTTSGKLNCQHPPEVLNVKAGNDG
jgi:hypothetical protein